MQIRLESAAPVPPFEQVRAQIALAVASGRVLPGQRLPSVRSLAAQLDVSPNTIARAYRELITAGIAEAAGRRGTRITDAPPVAHAVASQSERLQTAAMGFASEAHASGSSVEDALEAVLIAFRQMRDPAPGHAPNASATNQTRSTA